MSIPNQGSDLPNVGLIVLEGEEVEPYVLKDFDGVALFEIVDGKYRVERLDDQVSTDIYPVHPR